MKVFAYMLLWMYGLSVQAQANCPCLPALIPDQMNAADGQCFHAAIDCALATQRDLDRRQYVNGLMEYVATADHKPGVTCAIIWTLGSMQAVEAIPFLIDNLEKDYVGPVKHVPYRCANPSEALLQIGTPSLLPLLKACTRYSKPQTRQLIGILYYRICESKAAALDYLHTHAPTHLHAEAQDIARWINQVTE